jgi:hypothetical protein
MHHGHNFNAVSRRLMINHPLGELIDELAAIFFIKAAPCFGIALDGLKSGSQTLLELLRQLFVDAAVVAPASIISSLASSV